ncbi:MAG: phenylacetate--CoA ligase family protein, partial [Methanoregula sp.]|nr:phenylacetate--CoA ligase family protein [Methanoregula sp.]
VEAVVRGADYLTGEYRLIVDRAKHLDVLTIEVENTKKKPAEVQVQLATAIKARLGVSAQVIVHPPGTLPRETHKAKRIIDKRANVWE